MVGLNDVASPSYREQLRATHEGRSWGGAGKHHADTVRLWAKEIGAESILDYGCGRGTLKPALASLGITDVREFDPGILGKDTLPEPADLVVATDVLEHVEPDKIDSVLRHMKMLSMRGMYLIIALNQSKVSLPDGRNSHLIIAGHPWWMRRLAEHGLRPSLTRNKKGLHLWIKT